MTRRRGVCLCAARDVCPIHDAEPETNEEREARVDAEEDAADWAAYNRAHPVDDSEVIGG